MRDFNPLPPISPIVHPFCSVLEDIKSYICSEGSFDDWKPSHLTASGTSTARSKRFTTLQVELENFFWALKVRRSIVILIMTTQRHLTYSQRQPLEVMQVVDTTAYDAVVLSVCMQNLLGL